MLDKYFYVLCRDGQIIEVKNSQQTFDAVLGAMLDKGIVMIKEYGIILNGVDISKVLTENQYDAWVSSTTPKEYIKDGAWRDGKERKVIRYEKWKEKEIEEKNARLLEEQNPRELSREEAMAKLKEYRPKFVQEWMEKNRKVIPPHNPDLTARQKSIAHTKDL